MINEIIDQMGGRKRLEEIRAFTHTNGIEHCNRQESQLMALALLAVLDAQGKAFGCDSCGGNGAVVIDHGEMCVEHMECPKCFKRPPAASVPDALKNFKDAMHGIGHIKRTIEETFGGIHGTHCEPDVLIECKQICDAIYSAYRATSGGVN